MRYFSISVMASVLCVGCASYDIRNWDPDTETGQIVVFTGSDWLKAPTTEDAREDLMESGRCPTGYLIKERGWQGGGWVTRAEDSAPVTTTFSINAGGTQVASVVRAEESQSGDSTVVKIGEFQTQGNSERDFHTVVRSPEETQSSGGMRGLWFDFQCK